MTKMTKPSKFLLDARKLIATPDRWIKDIYNKRIEGKQCYCMLGALAEQFHSAQPGLGTYSRVIDTLNLLASNIVLFNDDKATTHDDIMLLIDGAVGILQAEGA